MPHARDIFPYGLHGWLPQKRQGVFMKKRMIRILPFFLTGTLLLSSAVSAAASEAQTPETTAAVSEAQTAEAPAAVSETQTAETPAAVPETQTTEAPAQSPALAVAAQSPEDVNLQIASTGSGLRITWTPIQGADIYVLKRAEKGARPGCTTVLNAINGELISESDLDNPAAPAAAYPEPTDERVIDAINSVIPASMPISQLIVDPATNEVTGYSFTDSMIIPGKEYDYYLRGYHTASGQWSQSCMVTGKWDVDIAGIKAGTRLTEEAVAQMGVDRFFYAIDIPEDVRSRMDGISFKPNDLISWEDLQYIRCLHRNKDNEIKVGELVMNKVIAEQVKDIFRTLYDKAYPIESMLLVDDFGGSDDDSIMHDNTSAFNFRTVDNTDQISDHAFGKAIDINPYYNVYWIPSENHIFPPKGDVFLDRSSGLPYILTEGDLCYQLFTDAGFQWGGYFSYNIDYQHFYYPY